MGKGSKRRPRSISRVEEDLRWAYATGEITHNQFVRRFAKMKQADMLRSGQIIHIL